MTATGSASVGNGVLTFEIDSSTIAKIEKELGELSSKTGQVLKNAVNSTAKQARNLMEQKAQETYTAKKSALNKDLKIQKATTAQPTAVIESKGQVMEVRDFKSSTPRTGAKAKILQSGSLKLIQSQRGRKAKAFLVQFASGHKSIVQRQEGEEYKTSSGRSQRAQKYGKGSDMTAIKKLLSISAPKMLGDEKKVFGVIRPKIYDILTDEIRKEIDKVVKA